jgi:hypothetical protein
MHSYVYHPSLLISSLNSIPNIIIQLTLSTLIEKPVQKEGRRLLRYASSRVEQSENYFLLTLSFSFPLCFFSILSLNSNFYDLVMQKKLLATRSSRHKFILSPLKINPSISFVFYFNQQERIARIRTKKP